MATTTETPGTTQRDGKTDKPVNSHQLVVVDFGRRQSAKRVKKLRKGRGKLIGRLDAIVSDLIDAGTLKAGTQPVVIVVREKPDFPSLF
jgi:hypothetical protein